MAISTPSAMSLAEKTYNAALTHDDDPPAILALWDTEKRLQKKDRAEWALILGIAIGIARGEDTSESIESVVARAIPAAVDTYRRGWANPDALAEAAKSYEQSRAEAKRRDLAGQERMEMWAAELAAERTHAPSEA